MLQRAPRKSPFCVGFRSFLRADSQTVSTRTNLEQVPSIMHRLVSQICETGKVFNRLCEVL